MFLLQRIGGYEEKFTSFFEATDYGNSALVSCGSNYLITNASRIASEPSSDAAGGYYSFDVCKN